ncbi:MAG: hypothetical protein LQ350_000536 [Teloschistes chrysophthalmus]|nr:MAG: hypothetical protein LQ350_000536 [Niorma chrysophthalma]
MSYSCSSGMMDLIHAVQRSTHSTAASARAMNKNLIRTQTVDFMRFCLDPSAIHSRDKSPSEITSAFDTFGIAIGNAYDVEQRDRLLRECTLAIEMTRKEQGWRLNSKVPSLNEYWEYRLAGSAVRIVLATTE